MDKNYRTILCFNRAQVLFIQILARFHFIKPVATYGIYHPITNKLECIEHEVRTSQVIDNSIHAIFSILINDEAKERIDRLLDCGYIMPQR